MSEGDSDDRSVVVKAAITLGSTPGVDDLERAMTEVASAPGWILDLLDDVLLDDKLLKKITKRSYGHPNGFAKIVLHDAGSDGVSVRLHVWPAIAPGDVAAAALRRDSAPHSHRWEFASTVVAGAGLYVEEFRIVTDGQGRDYERYVFEPKHGPELQRDGSNVLSSAGLYVRDQDRDVYWCDTNTIHTVGPLNDGMTATLVFQGPEFRDRALVFRRTDSPPDPGRRPLNNVTVHSLIGQVRESLAARAQELVRFTTDMTSL